MQASVAIEEILDAHRGDFVLDTAAARSLVDHMFNLMSLVTALGQVDHPRGVLIFLYTIKCHYLLHSALMAHYLNPSLVWKYSDEEYMQKAKTLLQSCQKGNNPQRALAQALGTNRYVWSLR